MKTPIYTLYDEALKKSISMLEARGIYDPILDSSRPLSEKYDESRAYQEKLSSLVTQNLRACTRKEGEVIPLSLNKETNVYEWRKPYRDN